MGMTIDEAIALVKIERECVNRNNQPFGMNCNRECGKCDLLQNTDNLIEMYTNVAEWLEELKVLRNGLNIKCDSLNEALEKGKKMGYNKAIDDFVKRMKIEYPIAENDLFTINDTLHININKIAE